VLWMKCSFREGTNGGGHAVVAARVILLCPVAVRATVFAAAAPFPTQSCSRGQDLAAAPYTYRASPNSTIGRTQLSDVRQPQRIASHKR